MWTRKFRVPARLPSNHLLTVTWILLLLARVVTVQSLNYVNISAKAVSLENVAAARLFVPYDHRSMWAMPRFSTFRALLTSMSVPLGCQLNKDLTTYSSIYRLDGFNFPIAQRIPRRFISTTRAWMVNRRDRNLQYPAVCLVVSHLSPECDFQNSGI